MTKNNIINKQKYPCVRIFQLLVTTFTLILLMIDDGCIRNTNI